MNGSRESSALATTGRPSGSWIRRVTPDLGIRFYSSDAHADRARRPTDAVLFLLAALTLGLISLVAPDPTTADQEFTRLLNDLPGLLGWFWEISYDLLLIWPICLVVASVVARGRLRLLRDQAIALVLGLGLASLVAGGWSTFVESLTSSGPPPIYPAVRVAIATALVATTAPHLGRPIRRVGRWVMLLGALGAITLGIALPLGAVAGLAIGFGTAALTHLAVGSPGGKPSLKQIALALNELGVEASDLRPAELEPKGVALVQATASDGSALLVKVYGRDAWDGQLLTSTWSYLWYRDQSPAFTLSRRQQVEHEAFVTLLAERAGVPVLPLIVAGLVGERDAVLVMAAEARPLDTLDPETVTDAVLRDLWAAVVAMHEAGIAHGGLDAVRLAMAPDGSARIAGFQAAITSAPSQALLADRAQLLVTTALLAGDERALAAAVEAIGTDGVAELLPYLQVAALSRSTRRTLKAAKYDLDGLREGAAEAAGTEQPKLEPLRRVTVGSILTMAVLLLAAYFVITAIAGIGIDTLVAEFQQADTGWVVAGLVVVPIVPLAQAFGTLGASILPLRLGPVIALEYAIQFIGLAVPSSAGRVALNVRFFQRQGAPAAQALTIGLIDSVFGFIVQLILLLTIVLSGLATLNLSFSGLDIDADGQILVLAGILLFAAVIVVIMVPRFRRPIAAKIAEARPAFRVVRSPVNVAQLLGGNFVAQLLLATILGLCVVAFGESATLAELLLINTLVSLFSGVMPVPGGIGVAEAATAACLTAIGIPSDTSIAIAVVYRVLTFYLPPLWGAFAMRWLKHQSYL